MRNKRLILALAGAVICGLLAVMLITQYLARVQEYTKDLNNVVVAKTEIQLGTKITADQLGLLPIPNGSAPEGAFRKLEEAIGRVAVVPIGVREPITELKLAREGTGAGLGAVIPEGYRAMTVKVDEIRRTFRAMISAPGHTAWETISGMIRIPTMQIIVC